MIGYISGPVISVEQGTALSTAVIEAGGIGYEVHLPARMAATVSPGEKVAFYIYTHLRADGRSESSLELYGFSNSWEKQIFLLLTSVSGVGFKTALSILSQLEGRLILQSIVRQDRATLSSVPGVGKKTIERIFLEITEKATKLLTQRPASQDTFVPAAQVGAVMDAAKSTASGKVSNKKTAITPARTTADAEADVWIEAQQALVSLGYRDADAATALREYYKNVEGQDLTVQSFITGALKQLRTL